MLNRFFQSSIRRVLPGLLGLLFASAAAAEESAGPAKPAETTNGWNFSEFIDQLPEMLSDRLPGFDPTGAVRLYVRPHFGDFIHRDFVRVPFGARVKVSETVDCSAELQSYFTHGLGDSAGYGLSGLQLGAKREHVLESLGHGGLSVGAIYQTPLSRPPRELSDGFRHFQPYVAATRPFMPSWHLLGFAGLGADILDRTVLPVNFGRNQLHANSLSFAAGAAREFARFHATLTATVTTSRFISDEGKQVYSLRPEFVVPWKVSQNSKAHILFTLGGRAVHGPDGTELGVSGSMRVEFILKTARGAK